MLVHVRSKTVHPLKSSQVLFLGDSHQMCIALTWSDLAVWKLRKLRRLRRLFILIILFILFHSLESLGVRRKPSDKFSSRRTPYTFSLHLPSSHPQPSWILLTNLAIDLTIPNLFFLGSPGSERGKLRLFVLSALQGSEARPPFCWLL